MFRQTRSPKPLRVLRRPLPWLALAGTLATVACEPSTTERDHANVGQACVSGDEDEAHRVEVDFGLCLSSSCDTLVDAACVATLEGNTLTIESLATIESQNQSAFTDGCTADCGFVLADCETPPLAAGTYTVVYGDQMTELTVASEEPTCAGELL